MIATPFLTWRPRFGPALLRTVAVILLAVVTVLPAAAQNIPGLAAQEEPSESPWSPPDPRRLSPGWYGNFATEDAAKFRERADSLLASLEESIAGLDPDALVQAQQSLTSLGNDLDLLHAALQQPVVLDDPPLPVQTIYTLGEYLDLHQRQRDLERRRERVENQVAQLERQEEVVQQRRETLQRQYGASPPQSPARLVRGIGRIEARVSEAVTRNGVERRGTLLELYEKRLEEVTNLIGFAARNLDPVPVEPEELVERKAELNERLAEIGEQRAALQQALIDEVSDEGADLYGELLTKQRLTRIVAEDAAIRLDRAVLEARQAWYAFHAQDLPPGFRLDNMLGDHASLVDQVSAQIDLWADTSEATLVTPPPSGEAAAMQSAYDAAQETARETITLLVDVRDARDDLDVIENLLRADFTELRTGLSALWARLSSFAGSLSDEVTTFVNHRLFSIGDSPITLGAILQFVLILVIAFALSFALRRTLERIQRRRQVANSAAVYTLGRVLHYVIISVGLLTALTAIGLDFSSIALVAGALSVGIGFGLQTTVNNFVSGLILLFEGSLKVGDYIEIEQTGLTGTVREINTRATRINTNDNLDVVVPNSELVSNRLTNWTMRDSIARRRIPFGVAYGSDKELVKKAALEAADEVPFTLKNPPGRPPEVWLVEFGDSSLDFELLVWVSRQGVTRPQRVKSTYLWAIEDKFRKYGVEIPFPQRDLHFRSGIVPIARSVESDSDEDATEREIGEEGTTTEAEATDQVENEHDANNAKQEKDPKE